MSLFKKVAGGAKNVFKKATGGLDTVFENLFIQRGLLGVMLIKQRHI